MKKLLITLLFYWTASPLFAQDTVVGFWEVTQVLVGEEVMTPIARWTKINADGTFQGGNGWLQNMAGTWSYDSDKKYISTENVVLRDTYGGFKVSFINKKMIWEREEDGQTVRVEYKPITELPQHHADKIVGLWQLEKTEQNGETLKLEPYFIFIRWTKIYSEHSAAGKQTGYWFCHAHRPELTLMSHREGGGIESWTIEITDDQLMLMGKSDTNKGLFKTFKRLQEFPND